MARSGDADQRLSDRLDPAIMVDVIDEEIAVELPIGLGDAVRFGGFADGGGIAGAIADRCAALVVGAELAEQYRPRVRLAPRGDGVDVGADPVSAAAISGMPWRSRLSDHGALWWVNRNGS